MLVNICSNHVFRYVSDITSAGCLGHTGHTGHTTVTLVNTFWPGHTFRGGHFLLYPAVFRSPGEIWGVIQPRALSQAACLKLGGEVLLHDWSVCKSSYTLWTHLNCFEQKSVTKMPKSVSKVCNSYCAHTFCALFHQVLTKCKTGTISVYQCVKGVHRLLKSVCKVCNLHNGHT